MSEREKFITQHSEGSNEAVFMKNRIQIELAQRKGMEISDWINKYSEKFQELFHAEVLRDPHLLKHDQETHNTTLDIFESQLYIDELSDSDRLADQYENDDLKEAA